jgi:hypothetical protein
VSAYIVLSDPVNGKFTAIDEYRDGANDTTWPEIASQANPPGSGSDGCPGSCVEWSTDDRRLVPNTTDFRCL